MFHHAIILKLNGIAHEYSWLDKHPDVRAVEMSGYWMIGRTFTLEFGLAKASWAMQLPLIMVLSALGGG